MRQSVHDTIFSVFSASQGGMAYEVAVLAVGQCVVVAQAEQ
jgi:hypothetical protein